MSLKRYYEMHGRMCMYEKLSIIRMGPYRFLFTKTDNIFHLSPVILAVVWEARIDGWAWMYVFLFSK